MWGPDGVLPERLVVAAADRGLVTISSPKLGRLAGVSQQAAWSWLRGRRVPDRDDERLRRALDLSQEKKVDE